MYAARLAYTGASPHRKSVCVVHLRTVPFLEHELHCLRRSLPCLPKKNGKSQKEETAAPSLRPENFAGHYPPRNSLPAVAQTSAPADATGEIFSLRAPASVQRGGELHQCSPVSCIFQMHIPYDCVLSHAGADPHTLINVLRRRGRYGRKKFSRSCVSACKKQGLRPAFRDSCEFI